MTAPGLQARLQGASSDAVIHYIMLLSYLGQHEDACRLAGAPGPRPTAARAAFDSIYRYVPAMLAGAPGAQPCTRPPLTRHHLIAGSVQPEAAGPAHHAQLGWVWLHSCMDAAGPASRADLDQAARCFDAAVAADASDMHVSAAPMAEARGSMSLGIGHSANWSRQQLRTCAAALTHVQPSVSQVSVQRLPEPCACAPHSRHAWAKARRWRCAVATRKLQPHSLSWQRRTQHASPCCWSARLCLLPWQPGIRSGGDALCC
jgi:hypothetical protein